MFAAIDVGSNTLRMLIASCSATGLQRELYQQQITRLGGDYTQEKGLARESIERTLTAFTTFADVLKEKDVHHVRVVGTAALRKARNSQHLTNLVKMKTRLDLEVISGTEEARLSATGVLSVLDPVPSTALIFDVGGGSTEIVFQTDGAIRFAQSYPLGVVQLCEEMQDTADRQAFIKDMVVKISTDLLHAGVYPSRLQACQLIGTAGTVTTLAAMNLKMKKYNPDAINNHLLKLVWLDKLLLKLSRLSVADREKLVGLEEGRGDIILPGLELTIALCRFLGQPSIRVADAGLLEGILLDFYQNRSD